MTRLVPRTSFAALALLVAAALAPALAPALAQEPGPSAPAPPTPATPAERLAAARRALAAEAPSLSVAGAAVGFAGQPGRFYLLARELADAGRGAEDFAGLLKGESVALRAAGAYCLVQRCPEQAARLLAPLLESEVPLVLMCGGCVAERVTEGELIKRLIKNVNLLECGPASQSLAAAARFSAARAALLALPPESPVSGSHVGRGAQPGRFYVLSQELAETGQPAQLEALVSHERALLRAAGMVALARTQPPGAYEAIAARAQSQVELRYQPGGCDLRTIREGELAQALLANANLLDPGQPARPVPVR